MRNACVWMCLVVSYTTVLAISNQDAKQPHIVLIVADDLGFNDVPWHNDEVYAPTMDRLAKNGVILENSYVQPLCTPSRSALMTGLYPFALGRQRSVLWPLMPTGLTLSHNILPQFMKSLGYETHAIGKWHLGFCNRSYIPTERGFDTFRGFYTGSEDYYRHDRLYAGEKGYDYRDGDKPYYNASSVYSADDFASRFEELLKGADPSKPKLFYVPFQSVHSPRQVPSRYLEPYKHIQDKQRRIYLGMVSALDDAMGRIETAMKTSDHYKNSVIIFTTDNGGPTITAGNNWPLRGNKSTLWEGGTRGAAFVHSPLLCEPGRISNNLIHITDWLATIVSLAGGAVPKGIDGIDQWKGLNGEGPAPRHKLIYNIDIHHQMNAAIRFGEYKLIVGDPGIGEWIPPPEQSASLSSTNEPRNQQSWIEKLHSAMSVAMGTISDWFAGRTELQQNMAERSNRTDGQPAIQLYNLRVDPEERNDISRRDPKTVKYLFNVLMSKLDDYVPPDLPVDDPAGNPALYNGVWSPGWC